ncbi:MAG: hypothetical protein IJJ33_17625 [Victivallales bacterium]|nr:hypothetical protein [Victivallales bacterium]
MSHQPLEMLRACCPGIEPYLREPPGHPEYCFYGLGDSPNWSTQCTAKAFVAYGELAAHGDAGSGRLALRLLRYLLATHKSGEFPCVDGLHWGNTWISALSLERTLFVADSLETLLTDADRAAIRRVILNEADYLLTHPILADIDASTNRNRPEANIWNGGMLLRAALEYPDAPRAAEYHARGLESFVNGICLPGDADNRLHGANFTENYALNHHCYLNVGYMAICLSDIGITHFMFRDAGREAPAEVYHHAAELWRVLKSFIFPDGRLCRVGGDSRIRYAYCQLYLPLIAAWAEDYLGDADAPAIYQGALELLAKDQRESGGQAFFKARLSRLEHDSYQYYCRLESDAFAMLAFAAHYEGMVRHRHRPQPPSPTAWTDAFHGAAFLRSPRCIRSWCAKGADGPLALCLPVGSSDLGEWLHNLTGEVVTPAPSVAQPVRQAVTMREECFVAASENVRVASPFAEGEEISTFLRQQFAVAALPDGATVLLLEYTTVLREITFDRITGIDWKIPNDLFNGYRRRYQSEGLDRILEFPVGRDSDQGWSIGNPLHFRHTTLDSGGALVTVDDRVSLRLLYGAETLRIRRDQGRNVLATRWIPPLPSLYVDVVGFEAAPRRARAGEVLLDTGCAVSALGWRAAQSLQGSPLTMPGLCRGVEILAADGKAYRLTANFGKESAAGLAPGAVLLEGAGVRLEA